jgi:hypothetical protein
MNLNENEDGETSPQSLKFNWSGEIAFKKLATREISRFHRIDKIFEREHNHYTTTIIIIKCISAHLSVITSFVFLTSRLSHFA